MDALLTYLAGAATVIVGQFVSHRYSSQRDRRSEFTAVVDRTIQSFVAGDSALSHLIAMVGTGKSPELVQAAADRVTEHEIGLRAARFSLAVRLPHEHALNAAFDEAHGAFTATYLSLGSAMMKKQTGMSAVRDADACHGDFRNAFDQAIDVANHALKYKEY